MAFISTISESFAPESGDISPPQADRTSFLKAALDQCSEIGAAKGNTVESVKLSSRDFKQRRVGKWRIAVS